RGVLALDRREVARRVRPVQLRRSGRARALRPPGGVRASGAPPARGLRRRPHLPRARLCPPGAPARRNGEAEQREPPRRTARVEVWCSRGALVRLRLDGASEAPREEALRRAL